MKRWIALALLAVFAAPLSSFSAGLIIVDNTHLVPGPGPVPPHVLPPPRPPHPMPPWRPHAFAPLEVTSIGVNTRINDQVALTIVDQEFHNPNAARLEGTFVFPVPKGAHLDKFSMEIDGKHVDAELLKAEKARQIYEDIVRKQRDPALLEYSGQDLFKVRIFPIEPNSTKRIKLSYAELLQSDNGLVSYLLPLNTAKYSAQPIKSVTVKVELDSKRPLKSIYSPSHAVDVKRSGPNHATAAYEATNVQPKDDFALYFAPEKDELGVNLVTHKLAGEDGYFLLLASPGIDVKERELARKDVVFVLDTSGSMAGKKLDQAKNALKFCVESVNEGDRFELVRFSTEVEPLFDKLVDASPANRARAQEFIKDLKAAGGTDIDGALQKALSLVPRSSGSGHVSVVVFLTDGMPTIGTTHEPQILTDVRKANPDGVRIFCFGVGTDVNTHLLDKVAEESRASTQYVFPEEDIEVKVSNFFARIKDTVLANPVLKFTGDIRVMKLHPSPLPDLFKGDQLVLLGRYTGHGASAVVLEGLVNGIARKFTYDVNFPEQECDRNEFIPRLWATRRVGYLLDEIRLHGENSELRDEVTDLARKYGIVTPYTAYLILEDETRRNVPVTIRSLPELERDHSARAEAGRTWNQFTAQMTGESAVADASYSMSLKSAAAPLADDQAARLRFMRRYGLSMQPNTPGSPTTAPFNSQPSTPISGRDSAPQRLLQYSQQSRFVLGKTFFQNGTKWVDSAIQKSPEAKRTRLQFGSPEYFDFLTKNREAAPWLALGSNVEFLLSNTIYEISE